MKPSNEKSAAISRCCFIHLAISARDSAESMMGRGGGGPLPACATAGVTSTAAVAAMRDCAPVSIGAAGAEADAPEAVGAAHAPDVATTPAARPAGDVS